MRDRPLEDWEYPDGEDEWSDELSDTEPCPSCGADIYEDSERCPVCGEYVVGTALRQSRWPWWFAALGLCGIVAVIIALIWG